MSAINLKITGITLHSQARSSLYSQHSFSSPKEFGNIFRREILGVNMKNQKFTALVKILLVKFYFYNFTSNILTSIFI